MNSVSVWEEKVIIPTYEIGEAEKNPMFLEKRVYQGSCVYKSVLFRSFIVVRSFWLLD